ncbi:MAG: glycosyltransferase family 4 protein, partial [Asgard group archaeon]|nr:glycosyltransferase family 4 protein [Asgard group archaeon]
MKLLNVAPHLQIPGNRGGAIHQYSLSQALVEQGIDVHLLCQVNKKQIPTGEGFYEGIHFHDISASNRKHLGIPYYTLQAFKKTIEICRKFQIDVVHDRAYLLGGGGTLGGKICNKIVGIQLDEFWLESYQRIYGETNPFVRSQFFTATNLLWLAIFLKRGDILLPVSDDLGETVSKVFNIANSKIKTIRNGVNTDFFSPENINTKKIFEKFPQLKNFSGPIIGFMGEVAPWQGVETYIDAANIVIKNKPDTKFLIIGGLSSNKTRREHLTKLQKKIESTKLKNQMIITGQQDHSLMPAFLNLCNVFIAPFSEGGKRWSYGFSPLKIYEYLSMGKPVIATDISWIKEIMSKDCGYIIPPKNPTLLAEKIVELLNNSQKRKIFGKNARNFAKKNLD